jgi:ribose 1,5-bisphosphokinase PhnN
MSRTVFLIAGPSGSGKTTLTQALVQRIPRLTKGITVTTRAPRPGEVSGKDYHFVTPEQFAKMEREGELLETDHAYNESYGVPFSAVEVVGDVALTHFISCNGSHLPATAENYAADSAPYTAIAAEKIAQAVKSTSAHDRNAYALQAGLYARRAAHNALRALELAAVNGASLSEWINVVPGTVEGV